MTSVIYLHGLASSPASVKGRFFEERFRGWGFDVVMPDLNEPEFETLTVSRALERTLRIIDDLPSSEPLFLMGSSFGGLVCALAASRRTERVRAMCLMAPAFDMDALWEKALGGAGMAKWRAEGFIPIDHPAYDREQRLGFHFYQDATGERTKPKRLDVPVLVFHGAADDVVDPIQATRFGELNPKSVVRVLDDGHDLLDSMELMGKELEGFLRDEGLIR
jgi:hypothetical protein